MTAVMEQGIDRRAAVVMLLVSVAVLIALAVWLVPWSWVPGGSLTPLPAHDLFTQAQIDRAEHFAAVRRALGWSAYGISLLLSLALGFTSYGARLVRLVSGPLPWWGSVAVGTLVLLLLGRLLTLPLALLLRRQSLDYGLTHQGIGGWTSDQVKSLLVGWVITSLVLLVIIGCARRSPTHWFLWAGGLVVMLTVLGSFLYPVVVEPLFNKFTPMPDSPLRTEILHLAHTEGVAVDQVLVADASRRTTTLNAYVSGIGSTRRVVVYDTLLKDMTPGEVRAVVAHELAHAKHNDVLIGTALGAVGSLAGISLLALLLDTGWMRSRASVSGPGDPAVVALLLALFALASFLTSPVVNTVSRAIEIRADRDSLAATGEPQTFVDMQRRLALQAIQDPTPPWLSQLWFGTHPTVLQRAGLPQSLAEARR